MSWSAVLESATEHRRSRSKASVYMLRFGEDACARVNRSLFVGAAEDDTESSLCGVSFCTWEVVPDSAVSLWELDSEATFDNLREIYIGDKTCRKVMYLLAVDVSEVCTSAIEKFLLQMEKHKKAAGLTQVPIAIVAISSGGGDDDNNINSTTVDKIEKIAERVDASLLFTDKTSNLGHVRTLVASRLCLLPDHLNLMKEDECALFTRLGAGSMVDAWGHHHQQQATSASSTNEELLADAGSISSNSNNNNKENEDDLLSYVERLLQSDDVEELATGDTHTRTGVEEEDPAAAAAAAASSFCGGCAHRGSLGLGAGKGTPRGRCEKCEEIRLQESVWMGELQRFIANVTKDDDGDVDGASTRARVQAGTEDSESASQKNAPAASASKAADKNINGSSGSSDGGGGGGGGKSSSSTQNAETGDATSFFQGLLFKN